MVDLAADLLLEVTHLLLEDIAVVAALSCMCAVSTHEGCVITKSLLEFSHVLVVIEPGGLHVESLLVVVWLGVCDDGVFPVVELTAWTKALEVVDIAIFEIWARGIGRKYATGMVHLFFMLLVIDEHLQHVVSVDQLMLQLLCLHVLCLEQ